MLAALVRQDRTGVCVGRSAKSYTWLAGAEALQVTQILQSSETLVHIAVQLGDSLSRSLQLFLWLLCFCGVGSSAPHVCIILVSSCRGSVQSFSAIQFDQEALELDNGNHFWAVVFLPTVFRRVSISISAHCFLSLFANTFNSFYSFKTRENTPIYANSKNDCFGIFMYNHWWCISDAWDCRCVFGQLASCSVPDTEGMWVLSSHESKNRKVSWISLAWSSMPDLVLYLFSLSLECSRWMIHLQAAPPSHCSVHYCGRTSHSEESPCSKLKCTPNFLQLWIACSSLSVVYIALGWQTQPGTFI